MATDVLCQLDQNSSQASIFFPQIQIMLGCGPTFLQVWSQKFGISLTCFFPSTLTYPGIPQSPSIPLSFLRIHPILSTFSAIVPVEITFSHLVTGLPSSVVPTTPCLTPLLSILHKSCPECYFFKWKYDHVPPFLSLNWLPINLRANNT